jgi:predicted transcriptional regulator
VIEPIEKNEDFVRPGRLQANPLSIGAFLLGKVQYRVEKLLESLEYRLMSERKAAGEERSEEEILKLVTEIVAAYVSKNSVPADELPAVIKSVHATLGGFSGTSEAGQPARPPAVPIRKSVTPDYIICLEDGKKLKMLKRYLRARHGLTPDAYRAKWNLPADYPMVAPNYAARRSEFAKQFGLGKPAAKKKA